MNIYIDGNLNGNVDDDINDKIRSYKCLNVKYFCIHFHLELENCTVVR